MNHWKWPLVAAAVVFCLPTAALYLRSKVRVVLAQESPVSQPGIAFTARLTEHVNGPSGSWDSDNIVHALRTDGAEVQIHTYTMPDGRSWVNRIIDMPNGIRAEANDFIQAVSTVQLPVKLREWQKLGKLNPATECTDSFRGSPRKPFHVTGHEMIAGVQTVKLSSDDSIARMTLWRAPALGCLVVKRTAEFKAGDTSELLLTSLTIGEPDPSLFQIPPSFQELSPSEASIRHRIMFHQGHPGYSKEEILAKDQNDGMAEKLRREDKVYFSYRPK